MFEKHNHTYAPLEVAVFNITHFKTNIELR